MAIKSDEFPYDMSGWVREKSLQALKDACVLSDWLYGDNSLPEKERETLANHLGGVIWNTVKLYMFGSENTNLPLRPWSALLLSQGSARLEEFVDLVSSNLPSSTQPAEYPRPVQRVLDLFVEASTLIEDKAAPRTLARLKIIELGKELAKVGGGAMSSAGKSLLDLVDQQTYHASLSWEEFVARYKLLTNEAKALYLDKTKRYRWEPESGSADHGEAAPR
ncbi:MAG: hypothetical protein ACJ76Y_20155 [Thermoanaerobaculia bacterium]